MKKNWLLQGASFFSHNQTLMSWRLRLPSASLWMVVEIPSELWSQLWRIVQISVGVFSLIGKQSCLGLSYFCSTLTCLYVTIISCVSSSCGVAFALFKRSWNLLSVMGQMSYYWASGGSFFPRGCGSWPIMEIGGSPWGSGFPSPR